MVKRMSPAFAASFNQAAMESVDDCNQCGQCVEKCPYDLDIPVLIREAKKSTPKLEGNHLI